MAYKSLKEAFIGLSATQEPKDLIPPRVGEMPSPPDMGSLDDTMIGSQAVDPFSVDQYIPTLTDDEGFIPRAKRLRKGTDPVTGEPIYEKYLTVGFGDYGPHVKEGETRTKEQDTPRFKKRVQDRMGYLEKTFPNFGSYPFELRNSMVSSNYRGSLPGSPKTIKLINAGDFKAAGAEFLKNDEYIAAEGSNFKGGIRPRMERLSNALINFGQ